MWSYTNIYIVSSLSESPTVTFRSVGNQALLFHCLKEAIKLKMTQMQLFIKDFWESVITRLTSLQQNIPRVSQMAYQKSLCSTHAYFNVKEMIRHYTERHSTMFVVLLDSMKAFDSVWHDALLLKLYKYNTHGKLWLLIDEMYRNMQSCIMFSNNLSRWFPLERGVREEECYRPYYIWYSSMTC